MIDRVNYLINEGFSISAIRRHETHFHGLFAQLDYSMKTHRGEIRCYSEHFRVTTQEYKDCARIVSDVTH